MKNSLCFILLLFSSCLVAQEGLVRAEMTLQEMEQIFQEEAKEIDGENGIWQMFYGNRILFVLTDTSHNRMRIFTPIGAEEELEAGEAILLLEANFHAALDAKYSLYNGFVVSVFTHPLKELTAFQLIDAMDQVVLLANNFGTSYSSTELIFAIQEQDTTAHSSQKRINQKPKKENE